MRAAARKCVTARAILVTPNEVRLLLDEAAAQFAASGAALDLRQTEQRAAAWSGTA
jgi:hypothetical protein